MHTARPEIHVLFAGAREKVSGFPTRWSDVPIQRWIGELILPLLLSGLSARAGPDPKVFSAELRRNGILWIYTVAGSA